MRLIRYINQWFCDLYGHPYPTVTVPIVGEYPWMGESDHKFCTGCGLDLTELANHTPTP